MRETQALIQAAGNGELETIQSLINEGVDLNAPNEHGEIALIRAASQGQVQAINALLEGGANVNATSGEGMTALIRASLVGQSEAVKALLAHGADRQPKDRFGSTALDWALAKGHDEIASLLTGSKMNRAYSAVNQPVVSVGAGNTLSTLYAQNQDPIQLIKPVRSEEATFALPEPAPIAGDASFARDAAPSFTRKAKANNKWYVAVSVVALIFISGAVVAALNYRARRAPAATTNQPLNNSAAIPVQPLPAQPAVASQPTLAPIAEVKPTPEMTVAPTIALEPVKPSPVLSAAQPPRQSRRDYYPTTTSMRRSNATVSGTDAVLIDGTETTQTKKVEEPTPVPTQPPAQRVTPIRDTRIYRTQPMATPLPSSNLPDTRKKKVIQWP
jgi:hypothetical protein